MNVLVMRSKQVPLSTGETLMLSPLPPSSALIVSNLPPNTQKITLLSHFQRFSGSNSIICVQLLFSDKALINFVNEKCKILASYSRVYSKCSPMFVSMVHPYSDVHL